MHTALRKTLPDQGSSDPPGPGDARGIVPAPPSSSSDDGPPSVLTASTGGARTIAKWVRILARRLPTIWDRAEALAEWEEYAVDLGSRVSEGTGKQLKYLGEVLKGTADLLLDLGVGIRELEKVQEEIKDVGVGPSSSRLCVERGSSPHPKGKDMRTDAPIKEVREVGVDPPLTVYVERGSSPPRGEKVRTLGVGTPRIKTKDKGSSPLRRKRKEMGVVPCQTLGVDRGISPPPNGEGERPVYLPVRGTCGPPNVGGEGEATETSGSSGRPPRPTPAGEDIPTAQAETKGQEGPTATVYTAGREEESDAWTSSSSVGSRRGPTYTDVVREERRRETRGSEGGVTLRISGVGDVGLFGFRDKDLIITIPVPGAGGPTGVSRRATPPPSSCHKVHEEGGGRGRKRSPGDGMRRPSFGPPSPRCYRCLGEGHLARDCKGLDRSRRCYRCSADSCRWRSCRSATPKCPLCADLGVSDRHVLGGCRRFPPVRRKRHKSLPLDLESPHLVGERLEGRSP